ncbi:prepilin-type N-terminal cleavage/methylation domain-containing protein [bacterium]|nr:prepilin-type N-terminal cleavage/methylation domain-containing protein [bacterium]
MLVLIYEEGGLIGFVSGKNNRSGATLIEVIISTAVFSVLMLTLFMMVQYGLESWRNIEGRNATQRMMRKVSLFTMDDIRRSSFSCMGVVSLPSYNANNINKIVYGEDLTKNSGYKVGQAIFMHSAYNTDTSGDTSGSLRFRRKDDGTPEWRDTILYYATALTEAEHARRYGDKSCGNNSSCPHKWLVRRVISNKLIGYPDSDVSKIKLELAEYIKPGDSSLLQARDGVKTELLSDSILAFRVVVPQDGPGVTLIVKSVRMEELRKRLGRSSVSIGNDGDTGAEPEGGYTNKQALRQLDKLSKSIQDESVYSVQYDITVVPGN